MIGQKSEKWITQIIMWLYMVREPVSCADLSYLSDLKMMQVEQALKILRSQGRADYLLGNSNKRLWYLVKHHVVAEKVTG